MPNRILKESICSSENIDGLPMFAEIMFYRLMVNCDDYGRMDARAKILKSRLFPLKDVSGQEVEDALFELESADLIQIYHVDGKPFLQMKTWEKHQQIRAKRSKYPSPDDADVHRMISNDIRCNQMISDDNKCPRNPIQSESEYESDEDEDLRAQEALEKSVETAYGLYVGRKPLNAEKSMIATYARLHKFSEEMIFEAVMLAARAGAQSVSSYAVGIMQDWVYEDIRTPEEAGAYRYTYDHDRERLPEERRLRIEKHQREAAG